MRYSILKKNLSWCTNPHNSRDNLKEKTVQRCRFEQTLPDGRLVWVEECGHCAHLEQPELAARLILDFIGAKGGSEQAEAAPAGATSA